jgi:hypothetical protein
VTYYSMVSTRAHLIYGRQVVNKLVGKCRTSARPPGYCLALTLLLITNATRACHADNAISARDALERFVGNWTTETHIRNAGLPPREIATRGKATCQRSLTGRYYEFRSETIPPENAELQIMNYDEVDGVYRQWVLSSDGYTHEATGRWDATTSTLRWEGKSGDNTFVIDDHWASPDRLEWTLRRTDAEGNVVQTIEGQVTRSQRN